MGKKAKSVVIFFVLLLIDQLTKLWAVKILKPIGSIKIIHNVLDTMWRTGERLLALCRINSGSF